MAYTRIEKIQTSFKIDPDIHRKLRIIAALKGQRIQYILENLVEKFVNENKSIEMKG